MRIIRIVLLTAAIIFSSVLAPEAGAATHTLPMTLTYDMMDAMVLSNYYNEPGNRVVVVNEDDGCTTIILSEPEFGQRDGVLTFETRLQVNIGKTVFKKCMTLSRWDGYLVLHQTPVLNPEDWTLSFTVTDSRLLTSDKKPAKIAGLVWNMVKDNVYGYLAGIRIDLAPPVKQLKEFLSPMFSGLHAHESLRLVQSIQPGKVTVLPDSLKLSNTMVIPPEWLAEPTEVIEKKLTEEEIEAFIGAWEKWDTFLVNMLLTLLHQPLLDAERQILLDTVLEARYGFLEELSNPVQGNDFVRRQFIAAWQQIHPIFRRHLSDEKDKSLLGYLAFFTASDALISLDALGPSLGIEITNDGFTRLVRMLMAEELSELASPGDQNRRLRDILGLRQWDNPSAAGSGQGAKSTLGAVLNNLLATFPSAGPAHASDDIQVEDGVTGNTAVPEDVSQWIFERSEFDAYVKKMVRFLSPVGRTILRESRLPEEYHRLYERMVLATAWQESCFRHYVRDQAEEVTYLRSYNSSSVGIMQINERVWKGIYDIQRLRWDIEYNAKAGCEILDIYFNRYALRYLKKMTDPPDLDNEQFAGVVYAMYNGGPGEFKKFLKRNSSNTLYKSDELFGQKFRWVYGEAWQKLSECLL